MVLEDLSYKIRGCIFEVAREMGSGLLEVVYEEAMAMELRTRGLQFKRQVPQLAWYKGTQLDVGFRMDLLVEDAVVIEIKSVEVLHPVHKKQLLNYLRLSDKRLGILVNFNVHNLEDKISVVRIVN